MNYHVEIVFCFVLFVCFLKQDLCRPGFTFNSNPSGLSFANAGVTGMDYPLGMQGLQVWTIALGMQGLQVWTITVANAGTDWYIPSLLEDAPTD